MHQLNLHSRCHKILKEKFKKRQIFSKRNVFPILRWFITRICADMRTLQEVTKVNKTEATHNWDLFPQRKHKMIEHLIFVFSEFLPQWIFSSVYILKKWWLFCCLKFKVNFKNHGYLWLLDKIYWNKLRNIVSLNWLHWWKTIDKFFTGAQIKSGRAFDSRWNFLLTFCEHDNSSRFNKVLAAIL